MSTDLNFEYVTHTPTSNFQQSLADLIKPRVARIADYEDTCARLNKVGVDVILEEIALGAIPVAIAHAYEVPYLQLRRWLQEEITEGLYSVAIKACADSLVHQAQVVLSLPFEDKAQVSQMRAYANQLVLMAERLNSEDWGIPMKATPPAPSVQINIGGGNGGGRLEDLGIPGLEALQLSS